MLRAADVTGCDAERELQIALTLARPWRRAVGVVTLAALVAWVIGGLAMYHNVRRSIGLNALGRIMEQGAEVGMPPPETDLAIDTIDDAKAILRKRASERAAWRKSQRQKVAALQQQMVVELKVQGTATVSWIVLMSLAGLMLLAAAVAGLIGALRTRWWHANAAVWMFIATVGTVVGILTLSKFGGLPPLHDPTLVVQMAATQCSYAAVIAVVLLATRRTA